MLWPPPSPSLHSVVCALHWLKLTGCWKGLHPVDEVCWSSSLVGSSLQKDVGWICSGAWTVTAHPLSITPHWPLPVFKTVGGQGRGQYQDIKAKSLSIPLWIQIKVLPPISYVALGKWFNLFEPSLLPLQKVEHKYLPLGLNMVNISTSTPFLGLFFSTALII